MSNENEAVVPSGSTPSGYKEYVIFAVDNQTALGINQAINFLLSEGIPHKRLVGKYNGVYEASYIVPLAEWNTKPILKQLASKQESIIKLDAVDNRGYRRAWLHYLIAASSQYGEKPVDLGNYTAVSAATAELYSSWSYDLEAKQHYVALNVPLENRRKQHDLEFNPSRV